MSRSQLSSTLALVAGAAVLAIGGLILYSRRARRYPPGPPQTWIGGNIRDLPKEQSWRTYERWSKEYGPVIHIRLLNKHIVILNTAKAATDLLDKRASMYSDRPHTTMNGELVRRSRSPIFTSLGDSRFPVYRRMMNHTLGPKALKDYAAVQEHEAYILLKNLLDEPDDVDAHIRRNTAAVIMRIAYGYSVPHSAKDDPFVDAAEQGMQLGALLVKPGYWLVDLIPVLKYLPEWFPGANFKRLAKVYAKQLDDLFRMPLEWTKKQMAAGTALPSLTSHQLVSDAKLKGDDWEDIILNVAGILYVGGADTTLSALVSFFYNMMVHPGIQCRAQEEIDRVIGQDRLPTMADRDSLPYLDQVIAELLRWCPPGPLALPHKNTQDDEYEGYLIPAGSTIFANVWAIMHDESIYANAYVFDPDRFSKDGGHKPDEDPRRWVWGFGRRTCPGQHLAEATLFINLACVLAVFDISKPVDEAGHVVEPPPLDFTTGTTTRVKPFRCKITPRSVSAGLLGHLQNLGNSQ